MNINELPIKQKEDTKFVFDSDNNVAVRVSNTSEFNIPNYDFIDFSNGANIKFYMGGLSGTLVATLNVTSSSVEKV